MKLKIVLFIVLCAFAVSVLSITSVQPMTFSDLPLNFENMLRNFFSTVTTLARPMSGGPGGIK